MTSRLIAILIIIFYEHSCFASRLCDQSFQANERTRVRPLLGIGSSLASFINGSQQELKDREGKVVWLRGHRQIDSNLEPKLLKGGYLVYPSLRDDVSHLVDPDLRYISEINHPEEMNRSDAFFFEFSQESNTAVLVNTKSRETIITIVRPNDIREYPIDESERLVTLLSFLPHETLAVAMVDKNWSPASLVSPVPVVRILLIHVEKGVIDSLKVENLKGPLDFSKGDHSSTGPYFAIEERSIESRSHEIEAIITKALMFGVSSLLFHQPKPLDAGKTKVSLITFQGNRISNDVFEK